ncbi:MAG TPA: NAD(P)/FAD-dependent oxidoreductase [Candidatus Hydrogenedentes bacterium]|nr:NAD(P)/FAD-dependent oxidoreductase [Candidatus Hydrogenedentota bacterium]HPG66280.1 NAD(P)/FAD-dependent oxidoreductase [Candidatus Hydrogenedentota bacterium]
MRIGIIGSGISGLATAFALARSGHHVEVFERDEAVGGLIATCDLAGTRVERYYHFLCGGDDGYFGLCRDLDLAGRLVFRKARTGFYYEGVEYPFSTALDLLRFAPIPFSQRLRFGVFALESRTRQEWRQLDEIVAKPWLIDRIGRQAYEVVWEPLLAMKFGDSHDRISAAWVWHRLHRVARSRGKLGYLRGGSGLLLDTLSAAIHAQGGAIHAGRPARAIAATSGRVRGIVLDGGEVFECEHVVSTLPLPVTADLLPEECRTYAESLRQVAYIGVVCATFKLDRPVTRNFWLNVHDSRLPFNGIIEYTNLNPIDAKAGHIVYVPYYVATDRAPYTEDDATVFRRSWQTLQTIQPGLRDESIVAYGLFRAPYAQAICPTGFLNTLPDVHAPLEGLHLVDSTFLYPEDRTQSGLILRARACAEGIERHGA